MLARPKSHKRCGPAPAQPRHRGNDTTWVLGDAAWGLGLLEALETPGMKKGLPWELMASFPPGNANGDVPVGHTLGPLVQGDWSSGRSPHPWQEVELEDL